MASGTDKKGRDGKSFVAAADTDVIGGVSTIPPIELNQDILDLLSSDPNDWTLSDFLSSSNSEVNPGDWHLSEDYGAASAENTNYHTDSTGGGRTVAAGQVTSIFSSNILYSSYSYNDIIIEGLCRCRSCGSAAGRPRCWTTATSAGPGSTSWTGCSACCSAIPGFLTFSV